MPNYPRPEEFQVRQETLQQWLKTRKNEDGGLNPGFFSTTGFSKDQSWSILAIIIELIALFTTLYGAVIIYQANGKMIPALMAVALVLFFIVFDIVGVFLHNNDKGERVKKKIISLLEPNTVIKIKLLKEINSRTPREIIAVFLFLMSAILKIYAILQFAGGGGRGSITLAAILTLFYLVVVYIHTCHTGYWLSEIKTQKQINKDYNTWVDSFTNQTEDGPNLSAQKSVTQFHTLIPMTNSHWQNGRQAIRFIEKKEREDGATNFKYELTSQGTMLDENIVTLSAPFPIDFKRPLIHSCLDMQLNQVGIIL